jgi:signal transduction histidine kinase
MVILHFILSRLTGSKLFMLKSLLILIIALSISPFIFRDYDLFTLFIYSLFIIILWNSFLIFFINLQNSISFRILREIEIADSKSMSLAEIEKVYPDTTSFNDRLEAMQINKFIFRKNALIQSTDKGKKFAQLIIIFRKLFGIENFG